jgi:hypothetical protein
MAMLQASCKLLLEFKIADAAGRPKAVRMINCQGSTSFSVSLSNPAKSQTEKLMSNRKGNRSTQSKKKTILEELLFKKEIRVAKTIFKEKIKRR